ncbi:MAG: Gfo/Idh/MocA family oxidoreductase [Verrucomicrobiales bacterium]|nr:Gfo/Idh/MocA family oxidoreductase [Verrucomicrobiales bacterium]
METSTSRRRFLHTAGTTGLAFTILPAGSARTYAANEKLNIAAIGAGGQARSDIKGLSSQNIVAFADVDWNRAAKSFQEYPKTKQYKDYRKMLDEMNSEIDAVIVAIPDHQHFHASMTAIGHGKHVYTEKPLTHEVWEARELARAAREAKVATQMGNQRQADENTRVGIEYIMDNAIGPVREAHIWTDRPSKGLFGEYWPQGIDRPKETETIPTTLDWDLWLGTAPHREYNSAYCPRDWRGWWDFGTGALGDIGCHFFDPVFRALKPGPALSVEASSSRVNTETYPLASIVTFHFAEREGMAPLKVVWYDGGLRPSRPAEIPEGTVMGTNGMMMIGDNGLLLDDLTGWKLYPEKKAADYGAPPKKLPRSPGITRNSFAPVKVESPVVHSSTGPVR